MLKKFSRKEFVKLSAIAGTGMLLDGCGLGEESKEKKQPIKKPKQASKPAGIKKEQPPAYLVTKDDPRYDHYSFK